MKKPTLIITATAALGAMGLGGVAYAQQADRAERGPMTREAVQERTTRMFERMDVNDDGVINDADKQAKVLQNAGAASEARRRSRGRRSSTRRETTPTSTSSPNRSISSRKTSPCSSSRTNTANENRPS